MKSDFRYAVCVLIRAKVKAEIDGVLDKDLPEACVKDIFNEKVKNIHTHFFDNYQSTTQSVYSLYASDKAE